MSSAQPRSNATVMKQELSSLLWHGSILVKVLLKCLHFWSVLAWTSTPDQTNNWTKRLPLDSTFPTSRYLRCWNLLWKLIFTWLEENRSYNYFSIYHLFHISRYLEQIARSFFWFIFISMDWNFPLKYFYFWSIL